jgi:hypothetical protein
MNCPLCDHDTTWSAPCGAESIRLPIHTAPRTQYRRIPWTGRRRCSDCGTSPGRAHHLCCEREHCPACGDGRALITCHDHFLWAAMPVSRR